MAKNSPHAFGTQKSKHETSPAGVAADAHRQVAALLKVIGELVMTAVPDCTTATWADVGHLRHTVNLLEDAAAPFALARTGTRNESDGRALLRRLVNAAVVVDGGPVMAKVVAEDVRRAVALNAAPRGRAHPGTCDACDAADATSKRIGSHHGLDCPRRKRARAKAGA